MVRRELMPRRPHDRRAGRRARAAAASCWLLQYGSESVNGSRAQRMAPVRIETASVARHLNEQLSRREPRRAICVEALERPYDTLRAQRIRVAERTTAKWRETDTEHGADVS